MAPVWHALGSQVHVCSNSSHPTWATPCSMPLDRTSSYFFQLELSHQGSLGMVCLGTSWFTPALLHPSHQGSLGMAHPRSPLLMPAPAVLLGNPWYSVIQDLLVFTSSQYGMSWDSSVCAHSNSTHPTRTVLLQHALWTPALLLLQLACQSHQAHAVYKGDTPTQGHFFKTGRDSDSP